MLNRKFWDFKCSCKFYPLSGFAEHLLKTFNISQSIKKKQEQTEQFVIFKMILILLQITSVFILHFRHYLYRIKAIKKLHIQHEQFKILTAHTQMFKYI